MKKREASLLSDTGRMMIYKLNIGERANTSIYNHYIYMQECYLQKKVGGKDGKWVEQGAHHQG
jgi:hypothetical protein